MDTEVQGSRGRVAQRYLDTPLERCLEAAQDGRASVVGSLRETNRPVRRDWENITQR